MLEKTDKNRIYQLIDMYLSGTIDETTFCNEFYVLFDLNINYEKLNNDEYNAFYELSEITSRFSEFEEDIKRYPGVYHSKDEVKQKILDTRKKLKKYFTKKQ